MEIDKILIDEFGFKEREVDIIVDLAAKQGVSIPKLIILALRLYQHEVDPIPEIQKIGCMGE